MCKQIIRLCSMVLIMAMLINMLPMQVLGEAFREAIAEPETQPTLSAIPVEAKDAKIVREITENRTEYSKEFLLSNGLRVASVYPNAVHYETQDGWQEIDNTLTAKSDGTLANTAGVWEVRLPQQMSSDQAVTITKDGYRLSFAMAGELRGVSAQKETRAAAQTFTVHSAQTVAAKIEKVDLTKAKAAVQYEQIIPEKLQSRLTYSQVYQNTDVVYDLDSNKVKESVVLKQYSSTLQGYRYTLDVGQLVPLLEEDGRITFYDEKRERIVMSMPAPFLVDDAGERSTDIQVQLTGSGSTYTLTYLLPQQWLADTARVWPVILDPAVSADVAATNIQDRRISQNVTFAYDHHLLEAGRDNTYGKTRSYLKFVNLPKISASDVVVGATIQLCQPTTRSDPSMQLCVEVRQVNEAWTSQDITWTNQPEYDINNIDDYCMVQGTPGYYGWVITDMVRQWYSGENHGLVFKSTDANEASTGENWMQFYSSDAGYNKPVLTIYFRNNNGLESYWDYTATSAGRAGTGYVNNFTGNLVWVHPDIGFGGNRMPVSISHIYNANDAQKNEFGLSYGWRTNFNQRVRFWFDDGSQTAYYIWEDEDGTEHYFTQQDGIYKDEDGLELKLTVKSTIDRNDPQKYCIEDKNGNKSFFHDKGYLTEIRNNQQTPSSITINYTTEEKIDTITDGVGRRYVFTYTDDLLLDRISYKGSGTEEISSVSFEYDEFDQLTYIWNADLDAARYAYANNGALCEAIDVGGYRIRYTYKSTVADYQPHRVIGISEYDDNTAGGSLTLQYAKNQTTITDHDGNAQILQFNDFGNTISVQDDEGNAQYGKFAFNTDAEEQNNADSTKRRNQLRISSKLQNTVGNILADNSFENTLSWSGNTSAVTVSRSSAQAYYGSYCMQIVSSSSSQVAALGPAVSVAPGANVTFSAYVKTTSSNTYLGLHNYISGVNYYGETVAANAGWVRAEVSFTNNTSENQYFNVCVFTQAAGTTYVDCVQAEKTHVASRYNLITNGDFRNGQSDWIRGSTFTTEDTYVTATAATQQLNATVYKIVGNYANFKRTSQDVAVSGSKADSFVFSAWAKGNAVPEINNSATNPREFSVRAKFYYTDGTESSYFTAKFNPDSDQWQYAAGGMVAEKAYSGIRIQLVYDYNANTAYFDGVQLYKEEFGNTYTYDSNGNVISVKDLQAQTTTYEYTANKLSKEILPTGAELTYDYYEGTHNVKTATTEEGLVYNFAYDVYGNNTSVSISSDGATMRATAQYTADGNYMVSSTDTAGQTTHYSYNADTGVLEWVRYPGDPSDMRTEYTYDDIYRLLEVEAHTDTDNHLSATYTYASDLLTALETASTRYSFTYGAFDQRTSVEIGDRVLATYSYTDDENRYLSELDYGNDDGVEYTYDDKGRLITETYEDGATVSYTYDNSGQLIKVTDKSEAKRS